MPNIIKAWQYNGVRPAEAAKATATIIKANAVCSEKKNDDDFSEESFSSAASSGFNSNCGSGNDSPQASDAIVDVAAQRAREIIENAEELASKQRQETQAILDRERLEAQKTGYQEGLKIGKAEGFDQGRKDGCEMGMETSADKTRQILEELRNSLDLVEDDKAQILAEYRTGLDSFILRVAEKVLCRQFNEMPQTMADMITSALKSHRNETRVRISVSGNMETILTSADINLVERLKRVSEDITIAAVPSLKDSECFVELPDQVIDLGVETQLENMRQVLSVG